MLSGPDDSGPSPPPPSGSSPSPSPLSGPGTDSCESPEPLAGCWGRTAGLCPLAGNICCGAANIRGCTTNIRGGTMAGRAGDMCTGNDGKVHTTLQGNTSLMTYDGNSKSLLVTLVCRLRSLLLQSVQLLCDHHWVHLSHHLPDHGKPCWFSANKENVNYGRN